MSNSQEQSLDENTVFLPVTESSPEFLYCERERQAVEILLSAGPEAFYSSIGTERSGCFLSSEEVSQITGWAQDYRFNPQQVRRETNGEEGGSEMEDVCSTYFPSYSDTPTPNLELGWPERGPWVPKGSVTVHTSPPAEGEPPVREIIRRHLQKAKQVIAIVTDRLTDGAVVGDLHNAASRGVPVYIILNQRSIQESFMLNRLRHPNMQVRVLGGKSFCSRVGRTVVGEMKDKFLLVDLETVIHGSYSLTWTDAHLHRQLITVLSGAVVDSFDREFRILLLLRSPSQTRGGSQPEITSPPPPPPDSLLDWEAMGVVQREGYFLDSLPYQHEEIVAMEMPLQNNMVFDKNAPFMDNFANNGNQFVDKRRLSGNTSPVTNNVPDKFMFNTMQPSPTDLTSTESMRRAEHKIEKEICRQLFLEKSTNLDDRKPAGLDDKATEPAHNMIALSSNKRRERSSREPILEEESSLNKTSSKLENTPSSRKPLILRVPQSESFSSLSDIMKRIQPQNSTSGQQKKGSNAAVSEMSRSMMDLSVHGTDNDEKGVPVPRFKASCFDPGHMTPAFALMKKRNDELKSTLYRTPKSFLPRDRPRSSSYTLNWRRSLAEKEGEQD